ncbi:hypothetical protein [Timonella senegalensis]|uniref:hypothetical protein n=1 Tax=Timonella senegalensis TaxID=1465825 RepID=UPI0028AD368C|nr:hypothetical protein [Timonella senegalensis]
MNTPLMMTVSQFAELHNVSETTVRRCIAGTSESYPPLAAKRGGTKKKPRIYITAEQAEAWRNALRNA